MFLKNIVWPIVDDGQDDVIAMEHLGKEQDPIRMESGFRGHFKRITREFDMSLTVLVGTRVSGCRVDLVICRLGFRCSFQVEAHRFRDDIWILWKESIDLRFLCISNQFIHMEVTDHSC
ncbi:hypothetical protein V6N13_143075 [Hibiscus sabdariffa]